MLAADWLATALSGQGVCYGKPFRESWGNWLNGFDWDVWFTVTFRNPRQVHHSMSTLNQCRRVVRRTAKKGHLFIGVEPHVSRLIHLHGLLELPGWSHKSFAATQLWRDLFETFGRSQVLKVREGKGPSFYVSKYVTKEFSEFIIE